MSRKHDPKKAVAERAYWFWSDHAELAKKKRGPNFQKPKRKRK